MKTPGIEPNLHFEWKITHIYLLEISKFWSARSISLGFIKCIYEFQIYIPCAKKMVLEICP